MAQTNTKESGFEQFIVEYLTEKNGFAERHFSQFDRLESVDRDLLFQFLETSQPREVATLKRQHGEDFERRILQGIQKKIKDPTVVKGKVMGGIVGLLREGFTDGSTGITLRLMFDRPASGINEASRQLFEANIFSVAQQVRFSPSDEKSLDLVVFINGLPVATLELKNELTGQTVKDAIHQYKTDRSEKEEMFRLGRCLVHFAADTEQVWMCTHLRGEASVFMPFNRGHLNGAGNPPNPKGMKTAYLWEKILTKNTLTDILQNFVQFIEEENEVILPDGKTRKEKSRKLIFPRFHQWEVVTELLKKSREHGAGRRYLIQHSAGSGKSNSISWLAHQLTGLFDSGEKRVFDSVVVVTDRRVLDAQIRRNILQFQQVENLVEAITEGSKQLKEALEAGKQIIVTTIQKFPHIVEQIGELPGSRFAIIIDEAHSSQSGNTAGKLNATLAKNKTTMDDDAPKTDETGDEWTDEDDIVQIIQSKKMLPNASYFAFTATPKNKTLELFGEKYRADGKDKFRAFHLYSMRQAIEEKFILDVLKNYTTYKSYYSILKKIEDDPEYDKKRAQKKLRVFVENHAHAVATKTAAMIEHFMDAVIRQAKIGGLAKAMVVTGSRRAAVHYKRAFDKRLRDTNNPFRALVAFSGEIDGETEASLNGFSSERIPEEFKKSGNRFLIVANKYQTGFDQPLLHTMYVDKVLGGVSAVQTLSRLNRTARGKDDTFVLDFVNTAEDIKRAFDPFFETTILGEATDTAKLFDLQSALDTFGVYSKKQVEEFSKKSLAGAPVDQLHLILDAATKDFRETLNEEEQDDFRAKVKSYVRLYAFLAQIVQFVNPYLERLHIFLTHLQNKLGRPADEDLAQGILDNIDMESYRLQKEAEQRIELEQGDELAPMPETLVGGRFEPEMDWLSSILKTFNEKYGTQFSDDEKVRKMTADLMQDVANDAEFVEAFEHSDRQNAKITFDKILAEKLINHINTNFEVYKLFNDNAEFKADYTTFLFSQMVREMTRARV